MVIFPLHSYVNEWNHYWIVVYMLSLYITIVMNDYDNMLGISYAYAKGKCIGIKSCGLMMWAYVFSKT